MYKSVLLLAAGVAAGLAIAPSFQAPQSIQDNKVFTVADFPDLGKGLATTPGCFGVRSFAIDQGKKFVIAAWFKNRKAMEAWYYSKMHQDAMAKFFPGMGGPNRKPFAAFKDENSPMLVVASVTPGGKAVPGSNLAVAQIAIEAYTPVPGGVAYGGTFAPEGMDIPGLVRIGGK